MRSPSRFITGKSHNVKSSFVGQPVRSVGTVHPNTSGLCNTGLFLRHRGFLSPLAFGEFVGALVSWELWAPDTPKNPHKSCVVERAKVPHAKWPN
ncbi:hypothetical protein AVEN_237517-1 [Araneus ventricosus]|uniref:Uncharacterized protein n=1 Tax=Araneus ventricosus TaxID=182803 RepID=A0A4Y2WN42_ARAVE|nr:hypothetical protein AVEN_233713-1 [Araneus ventricosus]GBO38496.1 hypothetical protein AVEN_237517-1 [Araneus ventricosus]